MRRYAYLKNPIQCNKKVVDLSMENNKSFLEELLTVAKAGHYGFTVEYLKNCEGLKELFGF